MWWFCLWERILPANFSWRSEKAAHLRTNERCFFLQWTMVCDRVIYRSTVQMIFFTGYMVGSIVFGMLADQWVAHDWNVHLQSEHRSSATDTVVVRSWVLVFCWWLSPVFSVHSVHKKHSAFGHRIWFSSLLASYLPARRVVFPSPVLFSVQKLVMRSDHSFSNWNTSLF